MKKRSYYEIGLIFAAGLMGYLFQLYAVPPWVALPISIVIVILVVYVLGKMF